MINSTVQIFVDLEAEFQLMKKMGLPTMLINSYDDDADQDVSYVK